MDFNYEAKFNEIENKWMVSIAGEIDIYNSQKFKDELTGLIDANKNNVCLDCTKLEYIDSTGLGSLVAVLKRVKNYNGKLRLINVKASIVKLFKITDLDKVFFIEGDVNDK